MTGSRYDRQNKKDFRALCRPTVTVLRWHQMAVSSVGCTGDWKSLFADCTDREEWYGQTVGGSQPELLSTGHISDTTEVCRHNFYNLYNFLLYCRVIGMPGSPQFYIRFALIIKSAIAVLSLYYLHVTFDSINDLTGNELNEWEIMLRYMQSTE